MNIKTDVYKEVYRGMNVSDSEFGSHDDELEIKYLKPYRTNTLKRKY